METFWQDVRFGIRVLRKNAGFTLVAVLTLALGIGANTALFSVIDAVLLRPLPYPDSDRLVSIALQDVVTKDRNFVISYTKLQRIQSQSQQLEGTAGYYPLPLSLSIHGSPEQINSAHTTRNLFEVLGVNLAAGRGFLPEDEEGGADVAIVTDGFWHRHLGASREAIGQPISLDGRSVTVVGVLPPTFRFPVLQHEPDVWLPRVFEHSLMGPVRVRTGASFVSTVARMKAGVSIGQVASELASINTAYKRDFPGFADALKFELAVESLKELLVGEARTPLLVLLAAVGFVLLIGCANVASLLLARATVRRREIAIRSAIGASRLRLVRQLLTESVLLSLMGGLLGILLAFIALRLFAALPQSVIPQTNAIYLNFSVLTFTLVLSLITGLGFGLLPSLASSRQNLNETLNEARGGSATQSRGGGRSQALLVMGEVAVAALLVIGAGVLIRSFAKLTAVNPGFDADNLTTFSLKLSETRYSQPAQRSEFFRRLMEEMQAIPSVQSVAAARSLPLAAGGLFIYFCPEGAACQGLGKDPFISSEIITPDYFKTMRIPLLRGRFFDEHDVTSSKPVVIINEATVRLHFAERDPIGLHITGTREKIPMEIVGVVADVKSFGLNASTPAEMYQPLEQSPSSTMRVVVRSHGDPAAILSATRSKIAQLDPDLPMAGVASMKEVIASSGRVSQSRLTAQFTGTFALLALLLTAIGIYGVVTYSVAQRTQEMGLRMALGANRGDVLRLVISQGMRAVLLGIGIGFVAALALTRLIKTILFGTSATDPLTFAAVLLLLIFVGVLACYVPARRASGLNPLVALRYE